MYSTGFLFFILGCCVWGSSAQAIGARCDFPVCSFDCRYGTKMVKDQYGCDICICQKAPTCPATPRCNLAYCPLGFKFVNGCMLPTCECNVPVCPVITCTSHRCPLGYAQDALQFGCPTCECRRPESILPCMKPPCLALLDCFSGPAVTVRGCPVCQCGRPSSCPPPSTCGGIECPHGFVFRNGCRTCRCRRSCPVLTCRRTECSRGFAASRHGCPTCHCNRNRPPGSY